MVAQTVAQTVLKPLADLAEAASFAELAAAHGLAVPEIRETRRNGSAANIEHARTIAARNRAHKLA
jgi:hypothetical protein